MGALFVSGFLVAMLAILLASPFLSSPGQVIGYAAVILAADLLILFLFGRGLLFRLLLQPVERVVEGTERIAGGDYDHRIPDEETEEMNRLIGGVNSMAERLIRDRALLAQNVRSLDETNRELVETTDQLVRTARLASVGTMASGIAHEIGNPLGALMGYLDVVERRIEDPGAAAPVVARAREEAHRIDRIIRSLLAFARPDPGGEEASNGIEVAALVPRVLDLLATQGVTSDLEVTWQPVGELPWVEGEPQHLEQVLVNLLVNARDALAMQGGGRVGITARVVWQEVDEQASRRDGDPPDVDFSHRRRGDALQSQDRVGRAAQTVVLRVEDDGPGIPDEVVETVFDPFVTTKGPGEGLGLGLAISARMVEALGGRLEAENREGGGARFTLVLPMVSGARTRVEAAPPSTPEVLR